MEICSSPAAVEKVALEICSLPAASEEVVVSFPADTSSDDDVAKTLVAAVLAGHANRQAGQRVVDFLTGPLSANRMEFVAEIGALYAQLVDVGGLH